MTILTHQQLNKTQKLLIIQAEAAFYSLACLLEGKPHPSLTIAKLPPERIFLYSISVHSHTLF